METLIMKLNKNKYIVILGALCVLSACNDYLDKMPDNRAEIDTEGEVTKILVEAYPDHDYIVVNEMMSDNTDRYLANNPNTTRYVENVYAWNDVVESDNESSERFWVSCYDRISNANLALEGIDRIGGTISMNLKEAKGEALLCRAFNHFLLASQFCMAYNSQTSSTDLGIPYIEAPETKLNPKYDRGTVAELYAKIDRDIQEGLPLIGEDYYHVPKYHFNKRAAYAFAARFYLFYEKWAEAEKYATLCLGADPGSLLRDYKKMEGLANDYLAHANHYSSAEVAANLLLATTYGRPGYILGNYSTWKKFAHVSYIAEHEDIAAVNVWGNTSTSSFYDRPAYYDGSNFSYVIFKRFPREFEYTNPVAGIGYNRSVYPLLTTDECLINRAEARVMQNKFNEAAADLTLWMQNCLKSAAGQTLTPEMIQAFYKSVKYSYDDDPLVSTVKKHLHPHFDIGEEGGMKESMLQCVLGCRRIETMHMGIRWWDIKRYNIVIPRRTIDISGNPVSVEDILEQDDPRRAIQIPLKARDAGMLPNPRK